ncbi:MAG: TIGR01777 family oxidoreductase [Bacteroidia bacterium]|nr:TIGR01777 family oxidoreductase [Bacteroidia bacterium]
MVEVLLAGGSGLIGEALGKALAEAGYTVGVLTRQRKSFPFAETFVWDGLHPPRIDTQKLIAVVQLSGAGIAERRWTEAYKRTLWESRVESTRGLTAWMRTYAPAARLISASAIGYYGASLSQERLTEESPPGQDFLAGLAQAWEKAAQESPKPPVIFRIGVVLSPAGGAWPKLRQAFRFGIGTYFAPGLQGFSWVHIVDVVEAFLWAIRRPEKSGVYNLTASEPVSAKAFAQAVAQALHYPILLPIPESLLHLLFGEIATTLTRGAYVVPHRLLAEGFAFRYPTLSAALADLLRAAK